MLSFLEDKTYVRLVVASLIRKYHIKHYEGKALIEILGWKVDLGIQPRAERGAAAAHSTLSFSRTASTVSFTSIRSRPMIQT